MKPDFSAKYDKALDLPFYDAVMYDYFSAGRDQLLDGIVLRRKS
jgi:hypothetical protein